MTFRPNNVYMPWRFEYVSYNLIKHNIQAKSPAWADRDESSFVATLWHEAEKVDRFITQKQREMEATLAHCRRSIEQNQPGYHKATLDTALLQLQELADFAWDNFFALQSLIQIHDDITGRDQKQLLLEIMRNKPLDRQRFDVMLVEVSKLLDLVSPREEPPASVQFWVHQENLNQVLAILHFHMPSSTTRPSITYLDNVDFDLYQGRLERDEQAEEIRLKHFPASHEVFVERETYHSEWLNGQSVTDGFRLDTLDKADRFLDGQYTAETCVNDLCRTDDERRTLGFIASGIERSIREKQLGVMMRMTSERTAFGDQVFLDQDIMFVGQETHAMPHAVLQTTLIGPKAPWLKTLLDDGLVYEVPCFSFFLHGMACLYGSHMPILPWWYDELGVDIRDARQPKGFKSASAFSKAKQLRPKDSLGYLDRQLEYPRIWPAQRHDQHQYGEHEMINIDQEFFHDPVWQHSNDEEDQKHVDQGEEKSLLGNAVDDEDPDNENQKKKKKKNRGPMLEPKVFFANERTFIHWLQFSALILVAALTLLNFGDRVSTIAGGVFFGISLAIALYAFGRFRYRAHQIRTRPTIRYDDIYGPIGLCILLVGAILLNFGLRYTHPSTPGTWLGINNSTQQQE
ncbi:VTC domain-containing protein [Fennellomyces sp. T-0311]|nr:VTC domain-containing protein [Fennellomyces sp. T-0311]